MSWTGCISPAPLGNCNQNPRAALITNCCAWEVAESGTRTSPGDQVAGEARKLAHSWRSCGPLWSVCAVLGWDGRSHCSTHLSGSRRAQSLKSQGTQAGLESKMTDRQGTEGQKASLEISSSSQTVLAGKSLILSQGCCLVTAACQLKLGQHWAVSAPSGTSQMQTARSVLALSYTASPWEEPVLPL